MVGLALGVLWFCFGPGFVGLLLLLLWLASALVLLGVAWLGLAWLALSCLALAWLGLGWLAWPGLMGFGVGLD